MLEQVLTHLHNWFQVGIYLGTYTIEDGGITLPFLQDGQYFRIVGSLFSECNRDIQKWFRVNSRSNISRKRFEEAVEYIQRWRPSTNMSMLIQQTNRQTHIYN